MGHPLILIHSLKLMDYFLVQADKPWYTYYLNYNAYKTLSLSLALSLSLPISLFLSYKSYVNLFLLTEVFPIYTEIKMNISKSE